MHRYWTVTLVPVPDMQGNREQDVRVRTLTLTLTLTLTQTLTQTLT